MTVCHLGNKLPTLDNLAQSLQRNISTDFRYSARDAQIMRQILKYWESPEAIRQFDRTCKELTSYGYWYMLSTLWVSYTGFSDLDLWKRLFSSPRKNRSTSLMKPSELWCLGQLPDPCPIFRAHRPGETDWIAYTVNAETAARFAFERGVDKVALYEVDKSDILALFTRRGEAEVLVLDRTRSRFVRDVQIILSDDPDAPATQILTVEEMEARQ